MWQQTEQDVLQKTAKQKIEYMKGALPVIYLFIIFCIYVLYEWSTEFLFVVKNMPVYWNLCVVMCVSESKRGKLTRKESSRFNKRKKGRVRCLSDSQQASALLCVLFQTVYFFAIWQPCLDNVNCRVQSVWWLTHFRVKLFILIEYWDSHFSTSKVSPSPSFNTQSEDGWAFLIRHYFFAEFYTTDLDINNKLVITCGVH